MCSKSLLFAECHSYFQTTSHSKVSVESTGALPGDVLVVEAIRVLKDKCIRLRNYLSETEELQRAL